MIFGLQQRLQIELHTGLSVASRDADDPDILHALQLFHGIPDIPVADRLLCRPIDEICHDHQPEERPQRTEQQSGREPPADKERQRHHDRIGQDQKRHDQALHPRGHHQFFLGIQPLVSAENQNRHDQGKRDHDIQPQPEEKTSRHTEGKIPDQDPLLANILLKPRYLLIVLIAVQLKHVQVVAHRQHVGRYPQQRYDYQSNHSL